jgi:hypothetical protein
MKRIILLLIIVYVIMFAGVFARQIKQTVPGGKAVYIFATFSGDDGDGVKLQIYTSTDGLNFQLYSNTGFAGPAGRSLRDPSIMKHTDGKYYIVFTCPPYNNPYANEDFVGLASSEDLKTWTNLPSISTSGIGGGVKLSWASEWVVDGTKTPKFIVHCSSQSSDLKPYLFTATDSISLTQWSAPIEIGIGAVHLDGQIIKYDGLYHCFIKNDYLEHTTSSSITGPWTWQSNNSEWKSLEGLAVVRLPDNTWRMYLDPMHGPAAYMDSKDLYNWSSPANLPNPAGAVIRHGTVILDTAFVTGKVLPTNPGATNLTQQ